MDVHLRIPFGTKAVFTYSPLGFLISAHHDRLTTLRGLLGSPACKQTATLLHAQSLTLAAPMPAHARSPLQKSAVAPRLPSDPVS